MKIKQFQNNVKALFYEFKEETINIKFSSNTLENTWKLKKALITKYYDLLQHHNELAANKTAAIYSKLELLLAQNNTYDFADVK